MNDVWITGCRLPAPAEGTESMAFVIEIYQEGEETWESIGPYRWVYADAFVDQSSRATDSPLKNPPNTTARGDLAGTTSSDSIRPTTIILIAGTMLGASGITIYLFRGRRSDDEDELFRQMASGSEPLLEGTMASTHVESFAPMAGTHGMTSSPATPVGTSVASWEQLPGGGAYQQMGATLVYVQSDGTPWTQQADGSWHR